VNDISLGHHGPFFLLPLRLTERQLRAHFHVVGISESGKSNFLAGFFINLLLSNRAATLIDPHGDLSTLIVKQLLARGYFNAPDALEKLLYLNIPRAEERGLYAPLNVLQQPFPRDKVPTMIREAFHRAYKELATGAATFDTLLPDAVQLLLHNDLPLTDLNRVLFDDNFRARLLERETDYYLVESFRDVYDKLRKPDQVLYAGSVQRRARQLTQLGVFRHGMSQPDLVINPRKIMDEGRSLIINLATTNDEVTSLIGSFLMVMYEQAAKSRENLDPASRLPHYLIVDEAPIFMSRDEEAFGNMLSKTRKYGLFLTFAHQDYSQLSPRMTGALSNAKLKAMFRLERDSAEVAVRTIGKVDPRSLSVRDNDETEMAGMREAWEEQIHEVQNLRVGRALVRKELPPWPQPFQALFPRPTTKVYRIRTEHLPEPKVDPLELQAIEEHYLRTYFRPASELPPVLPEPLRSKRRQLVED